MPAPLLAPDFDAATAFSEVAALRAALAAHDLPTVRAVFDAVDPDTRTMLVWEAGEQRGIEDHLRRAVDADPADTLAATLLAVNHISIGWEIRTDARAQHVSAEQFAALHDHLRRAERLLIDVTAREPDNAPAWNLRMTTARGLQFGQAETRRRYDRLARHHPHDLAAQRNLLQQLCPKWSGSWPAMHAFAKECAGAAPPGAPNAVLVLDGHLERWLDAGDQGQRYLAEATVRQEIREAAQRSVLHPDFRERVGWVGVRNTFAMMFWLIDDYAAAATQFTALGNLATESPWHYLGDAATQFQRCRAEAFAKGRQQ
ncbi:hypothetical protein [Polymorphospora sp. NPDC050346]|uniref:hypothetical protein n=1 Tax=Polymorphospora sp. NPDC050346 TaxID=3155780 RepID=UPI0033D6F6B1